MIEQQNWDKDITELESFFAGIELPTHPIRLNGYTKIENLSLFLESHFATVKANNGKPTFLSYLQRLQELKQYFVLTEFGKPIIANMFVATETSMIYGKII